MAYQTGAPANTTNLISTLIAFLVSDGGFTMGNTWSFTASSNNADTAGSTSYTARALVRDGQYVLLAWLTTNPNFLYLNTSSNNPTSGRINAQVAGSTTSLPVELGTAPIRYHMFSDGDATNCVVEWLGSVFQHINIGYLSKYGSWSGGVYVSGSYWNRAATTTGGTNYHPWDSQFHVRPFDGLTNSSTSFSSTIRVSYLSLPIAQFGDSSGNGNTAFGLQLFSRYMIDRSPNAYNGRSVLAPIEVLLGLEDSTNPSYMVPLGRVNNAAYINIQNLTPLETILTDWMVFPLSAKNSGGSVASGYINSGNYGIAYRK